MKRSYVHSVFGMCVTAFFPSSIEAHADYEKPLRTFTTLTGKTRKLVRRYTDGIFSADPSKIVLYEDDKPLFETENYRVICSGTDGIVYCYTETSLGCRRAIRFHDDGTWTEENPGEHIWLSLAAYFRELLYLHLFLAGIIGATAAYFVAKNVYRVIGQSEQWVGCLLGGVILLSFHFIFAGCFVTLPSWLLTAALFGMAVMVVKAIKRFRTRRDNSTGPSGSTI